ncbi:MAG: HTTM domain-containing protein [Cyclobacteriaceae bacterium]
MTDSLKDRLITKKVTIAPLVTFRLLYGVLMLASTIRFWAKGWIAEQFIAPKVFFPFVEGLSPLPGIGMYVVFALIAVSTLFIILGYYYRVAAMTFFLLFTYVELLDKTNYLNHYYFVSLISFLMIFLPANRDFSLDVKWRGIKSIDLIPVGYINILRFQMGVLYFFAGIAKINSDWLWRAQPMKMWLGANVHLPMVGELFRYKITAYLFSWLGMIYDTTIPFLLSARKVWPYAYAAVVVFHLMTWWLFPIGMFPFIMIVITTIFFPFAFHERAVNWLKKVVNWQHTEGSVLPSIPRFTTSLMTLYILLQLLIPMRYLMYPGNLFWTEEGYRFSWRVMLMEKAGQASFYVRDFDQNKALLQPNYEYLTPQQEKMMATQPDMIVQYAHFLEKKYKAKGMADPVITADIYVTLNGRKNRRFIDPNIDLTEQENTWHHKDWILDDQ